MYVQTHKARAISRLARGWARWPPATSSPACSADRTCPLFGSFTRPPAKSADYVHTRDTRLFLVAVSPDESGTEALDWLMESLIEDGDELVALRVIDWEGTGQSDGPELTQSGRRAQVQSRGRRC